MDALKEMARRHKRVLGICPQRLPACRYDFLGLGHDHWSPCFDGQYVLCPPGTQRRRRSFELKVTLLGIDPPIWRRFQVPSSLKLRCLHSALQIVMGWTDSHLHQFEKDGKCWGVPEYDEFGDLGLLDEDEVPISAVLNVEGDSLQYLYDFGDDWRHEVVLEKVLPPGTPTPKPVCLAGERRCPPEDVGGSHGYQEFLEAVFDPNHGEFEHYRQWAGDPVHAEEFDLKRVTTKLSGMRWPVRHKR